MTSTVAGPPDPTAPGAVAAAPARPGPRPPFDGDFTLALGGGGARGWAHIGIARALEEAGIRPGRIVGTSMGSIIGAGIAAGVPAERMERLARRASVYRLVRRRVPLALFDHRPVLQLIADELGNPLIEELPIPLGITTLDLVSGKPAVIQRGRLLDALERSIAVPGFFPPTVAADGVWCDAGPWEVVPVSAARRLSDAPVVGVHVDSAKPAILEAPLSAALLRGVSASLTARLPPRFRSLSLRRYVALLAAHLATPVLREPPDVLIAPNLGLTQAWQFSRVAPMVERGYLAARAAIHGDEAALADPSRDRRGRLGPMPRLPRLSRLARRRVAIRAG